MARQIGPNDRTVYMPNGTATAQGRAIRLYADAGGTTPADVLTYPGGNALVLDGTARVTVVDAYSQIPLLQYPPGDVDTIYASVNGGPIVALYATVETRLDAVGPAVLSSEIPFATTKIHAFGTIGMTLVGMDGAGRLWTRDGSNGNLSQSDDWGANWTNIRGLPASTSSATLFKVCPFNGFIYTVLFDTGTADTYRVYRAPNVVRTTTLVWEAAVFTMPSLTHANVRSCFNAGSQYLFLGTYTSIGNDTAKIYRTSDGTTWTEVYNIPGAHHIHAVAEDPYNAGHIYVAAGDNASPVTVARSTDHGTTWTTIISGASNANAWQSVQLSFSPKRVWLAADRIGLTAMAFDRDACVPYSPCSNWHYNLPVPGAVGGRVVTDAATTNLSGTLTSATAVFTTRDIGKPITGSTAIPADTYISAYGSATSVTMSRVATATASSVTLTISGDRHYRIGYWGAVDPGTESYYLAANDTSDAGNAQAIFVLSRAGGRMELLASRPDGGVGEIFVGGGYVWCGQLKWRPQATARLAP